MSSTSRQHSATDPSRDANLSRDMILPQDTRDYDSSDWHFRPLSRTAAGSEDSLEAPPPGHVRLNPGATLILGCQIGEDPHFKVYEVTDQWQLWRSDLIARVYWLDIEAVPPKVRRHRLRCIKRMASRTVFEVAVPNFRIIVCHNGVDAESASSGVRSLQENPSKSASFEEGEEGTGPSLESRVVEKTPDADPDTEHNTYTYHKKRTPYQQEAKKARQREHRQAARRAKRQKPPVTELPDSRKGHSDRTDDHTAVDPDDSEDPENFYLLALLYLAYDEKGQLYNEITPSTDKTLILQGIKDTPLKGFLEDYLAQRPIDFSSARQMEEYLAIKQSEIIFLKRQQSKMERIEHHYDKQFQSALTEWTEAKKALGHKEWMEKQLPCRIAQHQLKVARHVRNALPGIISKARETHRELKSRLVQVRQQEEETQRVERLRAEREGLEKEVQTLAAWTTSVVPCSTTFRDLSERWRVAWGKKELAEAAYETQVLGGYPVVRTLSSEL